jgi:hypothetical protein
MSEVVAVGGMKSTGLSMLPHNGPQTRDRAGSDRSTTLALTELLLTEEHRAAHRWLDGDLSDSSVNEEGNS